jgi:hypothetical protein
MSNKIEKLTPEQEAKMPEYVKKWISVATSTVDIDFETQTEIVRDFRGLINLKQEVPLVVGNNPIECWVLCCLHEQGVKQEDLQAEMEKVFAHKSTYEVPQASLPYNTCLLSYVFSFYDYMFTEVGVEIEAELMQKYKTWERTSAIWAIYPLDELTVICRKPTEIHLNENNVLHRDGGPALKFEGLGDFKIFALNGVRVPEYLAVTPSHQIDIKKYNQEQNADVKAEFVRKVGVEAMLEFGKKLDTYENYDQEENPWWWSSQYELWDMKHLFSNLDSAPHLRMSNQTTGVWHLEGVSPQCRTIKDAIKERFGGREMRIVNVA